MSYKVIVPLVQVATVNGAAVQIAKGGVVPEDVVTPEALANLVDLGYVEKAKDEAKKEPDGPKPGTVEFILAEVGDDKAKAQAALDEENAAAKPRKGLVESLEKIVAA